MGLLVGYPSLLLVLAPRFRWLLSTLYRALAIGDRSIALSCDIVDRNVSDIYFPPNTAGSYHNTCKPRWSGIDMLAGVISKSNLRRRALSKRKTNQEESTRIAFMTAFAGMVIHLGFDDLTYALVHPRSPKICSEHPQRQIMQAGMIHVSNTCPQTWIPPPWYGLHTPLTLSLILLTGFVTFFSFSPLASRSSSAFFKTCSFCRLRTHIAFSRPLM